VSILSGTNGGEGFGRADGTGADQKRTAEGRAEGERSCGATGGTLGRVYAAVDLGTNNCRMLAARATNLGPDQSSGQGYRVIDAFSRITRLGEGLAASGMLSEAAMDRTIDALKLCADRMHRAGVVHSRVVATEACRKAINCGDFVERVRRETGLRLEIIPAREEAHLALAGCRQLLSRQVPHALVFDIGGGSTELIWLRNGDSAHPLTQEEIALASFADAAPSRPAPASQQELIEDVLSLPVGVVNIAERYGATLGQSEGYRAAVAEVSLLLAEFEQRHGITRRIALGEAEMLGTSGTVTTLAGIHLGLRRYDRAAVDGLHLSFAAIEQVNRHLAAMSAQERAAHPCIGAERADLVLAGCAILEAMCQLWPFGQLRIADRGVREGILLTLIDADQSAPQPTPPSAQGPLVSKTHP